MEYYSLSEEGNPDMCYTMDDSRGHSAKWNEPVTNKQTKTKYCAIPRHGGTEYRQSHGDREEHGAPRAGEEDNEKFFNGNSFSFSR